MITIYSTAILKVKLFFCIFNMQILETKRNQEVRNIEIIKLNIQDIKRDSTNPRIVTEAQKEF